MDKFIKWLDKKGYPYETTSYGGRYFFNVSCTAAGVLIALDRDNFLYPAKAEKDIFSYCKKYGYTVISSGFNLFSTWYGVVKADAAEDVKKYWHYSGESVKECEQIMHNYHLNGIYNTHHAQLEEELRQVMNRYEKEFIKSRFKVIAA